MATLFNHDDIMTIISSLLPLNKLTSQYKYVNRKSYLNFLYYVDMKKINDEDIMYEDVYTEDVLKYIKDKYLEDISYHSMKYVKYLKNRNISSYNISNIVTKINTAIKSLYENEIMKIIDSDFVMLYVIRTNIYNYNSIIYVISRNNVYKFNEKIELFKTFNNKLNDKNIQSILYYSLLITTYYNGKTNGLINTSMKAYNNNEIIEYYKLCESSIENVIKDFI